MDYESFVSLLERLQVNLDVDGKVPTPNANKLDNAKQLGKLVNIHCTQKYAI